MNFGHLLVFLWLRMNLGRASVNIFCDLKASSGLAQPVDITNQFLSRISLSFDFEAYEKNKWPFYLFFMEDNTKNDMFDFNSKDKTFSLENERVDTPLHFTIFGFKMM